MSGRLPLRELLAWLVVIAAETAHGVLRGMPLVPHVGDLRARQIDAPVGSIIVLAVASLSARWVAARVRLHLLGVGLLWVVLTVLFEIGLGRFVLGLPWERVAEDYDPARGDLLGFGLLVMRCRRWWRRGCRNPRPPRASPPPMRGRTAAGSGV